MISTMEEKLESDDRFNSRVRWSNIPFITYKTHRLFNFLDREGAKEAYQAALDFISGKLGHHFLTFAGETGRGKTHLALGIGWHWLENSSDLVKYWQVSSLLDELRRGYSAQTEEQFLNFDKLMTMVKEVGLLILDDLGIEKRTEWVDEKLDIIIDHRYLHELSTVVTTNLNPAKLEGRLAGRLREGVVIIFKCDDYRRIKAKMREGK